MAKTNPWAQIKEKASAIVPPVTVLREQAQLLSEATNAVIQGTVIVESSGGDTVTHKLRAYVPALDNYSVDLLTVQHSMLIYPCSLWCSFDDRRKWVECENKDQLEAAVQFALELDAVQKVVVSLMSQATQ